MLKAMADPSRLRILETLRQRPCCVSELAEQFGDELSTVSQRLRVLRSERLVRSTREGKHVVYAIADHHVEEMVRNALDHVHESRSE